MVCDALQEKAVQTLRHRKGRPRKPLAIMAGSLETAKQYVHISHTEEELLLSPARPIVLLQKVTEHNTVAPSVAPGMETLGILLTYAPYHYSLVPSNALWVMTSANRSGDPVLYNDAQALEELQGIADYILTHNREIISPVDDSVVQVVHDTSIMIRRSRGYVPVSIPVVALEKSSTMLAMGADMKAAFAMNRGSHAILSPYMGDMEHQRVQDLLWSTTKRYEDLFNYNQQRSSWMPTRITTHHSVVESMQRNINYLS